MSRASRRAVIAAKAEQSAARWITAEVRYCRLSARAFATGDPVDLRRAEKARRRAIASGDILADDLPDLANSNLVAFAADLIARAGRELAIARNRIVGAWAHEHRPAHPLAWPGRQGWPRD